jgi:hypothetical protein
MRDITELMNTYRECSRNLWNAYFSSRENTGAPEDTYQQIRRLLFEALVVDELLYEGDEVPPPPVLKVIPSSTSVPILIRRLSEQGGYWDEVRDMRIGPDDIELAFLDYFDFSQYPIKDFHFYLCTILSFPNHVEYEGRQALIEVPRGRVFDEEKG